MAELEKYFSAFRKNIVGHDLVHQFPAGSKKIVYADWAASGRMYRPIEEYMLNTLGPYVANTHTETTLTGTVMTDAYHQAHAIFKKHVNASANDSLLFSGFGMTSVINKFQRILGLRLPENCRPNRCIPERELPLVVITHMEHHSNQTSWVESTCDVEIIRRNADGLPDLAHLREILDENKYRKMIIGSFTACSNVTGIITPYYEMAEIMHEFGRYCFVDFSGSAPYVDMNMHPENESQKLDAIFFSPHKFLGGPGSSGVILFDKSLYRSSIPDHPGGGTVAWTNPWGEHHYFDDIEVREDGGTPGFLQAIRGALAVKLKEEMGVENILNREHELVNRLMNGLMEIPEIQVLEPQQRKRVGFVSFYSLDVHYNLFVRLLNDLYGIQTRGGCSCAGTYGHILLNIDYDKSHEITDMIDEGDLSRKPGWVRVSIHPTMQDGEIDYILQAIGEILENHKEWRKDYAFNPNNGDYEPVDSEIYSIDLSQTYKSL